MSLVLTLVIFPLFFLPNSKSRNDDIIKPCLGLMANLCRHNISVQTYIKSQVGCFAVNSETL